MLKIPKRASCLISIALTALIFVVIIVLLFITPMLCKKYLAQFCTISADGGFTAWLIFLTYCVELIALGADISLFILLKNILDGKVFEEVNVGMLRIISWCCIAEGIIFTCYGIFGFYISYCVAFAAVFIGVILRVVKNVMEEAGAIKNENDLTV